MIYQAQIFVTWVFIGYGVGGHRIIRDRIIRDAYAPNCVVLHVVSCLSCRVVPFRALWRYFALFSVFGGGVRFPFLRPGIKYVHQPGLVVGLFDVMEKVITMVGFQVVCMRILSALWQANVGVCWTTILFAVRG